MNYKNQTSPNLLRTLLLIFISSALWFVSLPGAAWPLLTWLSLAPVGVAMHEHPPRNAGAILFTCSASWWLALLIEARHAFTDFLQLSEPILWLSIFLCALILASPYFAVGWCIAKRQWMNKTGGIFFISACYVSIVYFTPSLLPGNHAHNLYNQTVFLQVLDFGGAPLLTFLVVYVNWSFAKAALNFKANRQRQCLASIAKAIAILLVTATYGSWKIDDHLSQAGEEQVMKIAFVQPNLARTDSTASLYVESAKLLRENSNVELLVWPEIPAKLSYADNHLDRVRTEQLSSLFGVPILFVSSYENKYRYNQAPPSENYFNTVNLIGSDQRLIASYKKQKLVPFFEYLPFEKEAPWLRTIFPGALHYVAGNTTHTLDLNEHIRIAPLVCYEAIFPELSRNFMQEGANLFINMSNDRWLGDTSIARYHFALGTFRAIENRVSLLRVTNSGISGLVSSSGEINLKSLTPTLSETSQVVNVHLPRHNSLSFYAQYGDVFLYSITFILLISLPNYLKLWSRLRRQ